MYNHYPDETAPWCPSCKAGGPLECDCGFEPVWVAPPDPA